MLRFRLFTRPLVSVFSAEEETNRNDSHSYSHQGDDLEKRLSRRYAVVESGLLNNASKRISAQARCATLH
jgi:hypothetical protein